MTQKFTDIVLDENDMEFVENLLNAQDAEYELRNGFKMNGGERSIARQKIIRETKDGIWSNRDVIPGFDDGESQTSVDFNHYEGAE